MAFRLQQHDSSLSSLLWYKSKRVPSVKNSLGQSPQSSSTLSSSRSVSCAHTRWKSRPPERLRPLGSPARVRTAITFLGSVDGGTTTRFRFLFPALAASVLVPGIGNFRSCSWRHDIERTIFTTTLLHCIERDAYINKAPCRFRVFPALPLGMLILLQSLWLVWSTYFIWEIPHVMSYWLALVSYSWWLWWWILLINTYRISCSCISYLCYIYGIN